MRADIRSPYSSYVQVFLDGELQGGVQVAEDGEHGRVEQYVPKHLLVVLQKKGASVRPLANPDHFHFQEFLLVERFGRVEIKAQPNLPPVLAKAVWESLDSGPSML